MKQRYDCRRTGGMVLPDGLTFAQREFLYGFTVDPSLLQGTFIYTDFMVSKEFDASVDPAEYSHRWNGLFGQISVWWQHAKEN